MTAAAAYLRALHGCIAAASEREAEHLEVMAEHLADSVATGGVLHVFGTGHSQLVALELSERAGGLAAVNPIVDPALSPTGGLRAVQVERLPGYAEVALAPEDLRPGEVLAVVSNSGINVVPIDVAVTAADRGLFVVAVTSRTHSDAVESRHPTGKRLHEVAHLTLDTGVPAGDAVLRLGDGTAAGPLSTLLSAALLHAAITRAAELLVERGVSAPVLTSQNLARADVNDALYARYADRTWRRR